MSHLERKDVPQDPNFKKDASSLFESALKKLGDIPELKDALAKNYLEQRQAGDNSRIEFDRSGYKYTVRLDRQVSSESLDINGLKGGIQETVTICLTYDEEYGGSCRLFGGRRGNLDRAVVSHLVFDWNGNKEKDAQVVNIPESLDKTREFIQNL